MSDNRNFQVNLRGVITLLSDHLYSGPQVYIRELLQNAVDAITARQHLEPAHCGAIRIELNAGTDGSPSTLIVHDNGVGLTQAEVHEFLATIGQSSKREELTAEDFLGQFGIGLLSGFVVCEEIVVITRSMKPGSETVEWKGRSDGTYSLRTLQHDFEPGTQVFLRAKPGSGEFFQPDFVRDTATLYGRHLPAEIEVHAAGEITPVTADPPWKWDEVGSEDWRQAAIEYGREVFDEEFLDVIPLESTAGDVQGVAFVLPYAASLASKRTHRVYLKNMLLAEAVENILPSWAFFVKCVVNANGLRPTAARESIYEDNHLAQARDTLGRCLRTYLVRMSREAPERLQWLVGLHHLSLKALAVEDDDFYRMIIDWLPFETSLGEMTLGEYFRDQQTARYVETRDQFRQIASVASAQSMCVINAGYVYDTALIEKLPELFAGRRIEMIDASELARSFGDLTGAERSEMSHLLETASEVLEPYNCSAEARKFAPHELPTLYTTSESANFLRSVEQSQEISDELWSGILGSIAGNDNSAAGANLCLNYNNPLIRRLAGANNPALVRRTVEMLYVQALLLGHYPLRAREMSLLSGGLLGLIADCLGNDE